MDLTRELSRLLSNFPALKSIIKKITTPYWKKLDRKQQSIFLDWLEDHKNKFEKPEESLQGNTLISIVVPVYNTPKKYFDDMIRSVINQSYGNWELVLIDDASTDGRVGQYIKKSAEQDSRIKSVILESNQGISGATNEGFRVAKGDFVALLDHDDVLHTDALWWIAKEIENDPDVCFIYTDESKMDESGKLYQPFFKPDWNFDMLRSINYITHFTAIRRDILISVGGEDSSYDGAQDWELFLRVTRSLRPTQIKHIGKILYYWRVHSISTALLIENKPYVAESQKKVLMSDVLERGARANVVRNPRFGAQWQVDYFSDKKYDRKDIKTVNIVHKNTSITAGMWLDGNPDTKFVLITQAKNDISDEYLYQLMHDADRAEVGWVSPQVNDNNALHNASLMIDGDSYELIRRLSNRSFAKHVYTSTKYSLPGPHDLLCSVIIAKKKLELIPSDTLLDIESVCRELTQEGFRGVYIPNLMIEY